MRKLLIIAAGLAGSFVACASHHATGVAEMQGPSRSTAWDQYEVAESLVQLGRTDDAVAEYRRAQQSFGDRNPVGQSMAIYGRARALDLAGRCRDAVPLYVEYATFVRRREPASAQAALSVARQCREVPPGDPALTQTADALAASDYPQALALAERVNPSTTTAQAWLDYDRGEALIGLRRTDEAVAALERAQESFDETGDVRGRAAAAWGKARALEQAGRCPDAARAYVSYERLVRSTDPRAAELAESHAQSCNTTVLAR